MHLADVKVVQFLIPVDDFEKGGAFYKDVLAHIVNRTPKSELWLAEFTDPDGNQLALMSEVSVASA